ncbi:MAG: proline iminopeptidase-family hydrolase, partial [Burkholderiales bacterium]|nr:proline iminopeptidase-family hydrolase [Burkholderiales bacterium]
MRITEGFLPVDGHRVWWKRVDPPAGTPAAAATPILLMHGGPGAGHDYLEPLEALAADRPVIFWDQLGCGRSDQPDDLSLWTIDRFRREVDVVRAGLGLDRIHLLGQSWGGWLGIEYMVHQPPGIVGLVLASTSASIPQFVAEAETLKAQMPAEMYATMRRCEAAGRYRDPDYEAAVQVFYRRHVCRLDPWPDCLARTSANLDGNAVYATINGPNEFVVTGELKDWDRIA